MEAIGGSVQAVRRGLLALAWAIVVAVGLSGCGTTPPGDDIPTASDESEARKRARIRLQLAVGYFEQGKTTVALDEVKQALAVDPAFVDAYNLRGLIYTQLNDARLAEESFRRALALNPNDPNVLHNYGWMLCLNKRYAEGVQTFDKALAVPTYGERAKTWLTRGLCQIRAGQLREAEESLAHSMEFDARNPITGYNLALLLYQRGDLERAQFYIRRVNNGEFANAETLWLGIKIEHRLGNRVARDQLGTQLRNRFPQSPELALYDRGAFYE
ncbi:MAG: type IV pilus biogenesis/stability protein PilW [Hylemonella sp.]